MPYKFNPHTNNLDYYDASTTGTLAQFAPTTSAQLAGVITDETGSGALVFGTSPTFTTGITVPKIIGGAAVGSGIEYVSTTGAGTPTGSAHIFKGGTNGATTALTIFNNGRTQVHSNLFLAENIPLYFGTSTTTNVGRGKITADAAGLLFSVEDTLSLGNYTNLLLKTASYDGISYVPHISSPSSSLFGMADLFLFDPARLANGNLYITSVNFATTSDFLTVTYDTNNREAVFQNSNLQGCTVQGKYIRFGNTGSVPSDAARVYIDNTNVGILGVGTYTPTAKIHIAAGTAAASTSPLKLTSGALMTIAEAGAIEFLTDTLYATITTGAARKKIVLAENSGAARMPQSGTALVTGNAVLVAGTVTVSTTAATTNAKILLTRKTSGGTVGNVITYTINAGVSFTITSDNALDTSTFTYLIIEGF